MSSPPRLPALRDHFAASFVSGEATVRWLYRHFSVTIVRDGADVDGLTQVAHRGPRLDPTVLRPFYGALAGVSRANVLLPRVALGALPAPCGRGGPTPRRHPSGLHPEFAGHPVFFLPLDIARQREGEDDDLYAARLWCELEARGVGDVAQGAVVDLIERAGLDIVDPAERRRIGAWVDGRPDAELDALVLPEPVAASCEPALLLSTLTRELEALEHETGAALSALVGATVGLADDGLDGLLAPFDEAAAELLGSGSRPTAQELAQVSAEAVGAVYAVIYGAHLLSCSLRAQLSGTIWPSLADMEPVNASWQHVADEVGAAIEQSGTVSAVVLDSVRQCTATAIEERLQAIVALGGLLGIKAPGARGDR